jgi:hypothetical protein
MSVLWERCERKEWCVNIPFDGKKCVSASGCVRLIEESGNYYLEIEIGDVRQRMNLGNSCIEARWYVFAAKVCLGNVQQAGSTISFDVILRLCVDVNLGPIHIGECVDLFRQHVEIHLLTDADLRELGFSVEGIPGRARGRSGGAYAYVETQLKPENAAKLEKAFEK